MLELFSYVKVLADLYIIYSNDENERLCALTQSANKFQGGGKCQLSQYKYPIKFQQTANINSRLELLN